ncbi:MAG: dockerin type I domain-containing protein [Bacteroidetes bacterium]|nr:dockerin type I domain-containing protein [Bacteroidota bacterium]
MCIRTILILFGIVTAGYLRSQSLAEPLPYSQYFDGEGFPAGWTQQHDENISIDDWSVSESDLAGGSANEMMATWNFGMGVSRLVTPPLLTGGFNVLMLNFRHFMSDYFFGTEFAIQSSTDGINWTDENWSAFSGSGDLGPELVSTTIVHNLGDTTFIAFTIRGDHFQFWNWYIDEVEIGELTTPPGCTTAVLPLNNEDSVPTNYELKWDIAPGATNYFVFVGTDNPPTNVLNGYSTNSNTFLTVYNLKCDTQYYWKVVPSNPYGQPAECPVWSFTTLSPFPLPFIEHLDHLNMPFAWIEMDSAVTKGWHIYQGNFAGGSPNELELDFKPGYGTSRLISPPIQTAGQFVLTLSFKILFGDDSAGMSVRVQTSADAIHWTDEDFVYNSGNGNFGPAMVTLPLSNNLGGVFYIAFVAEGNLHSFNYWIIDDIEVAPGGSFPGTISGSINYDNNAHTPLINLTVYLNDVNGIVTDSTLTNTNGEFLFTNVLQGNYYFTYRYNHVWGGGNAIDALLIMKHFALMTHLSGVKVLAADVNNSGTINSVDALLTMRRFVLLITSFASGDWCFDTRDITLPPNGSVIKQIKSVCYGDVDGSFTPL